MPDRRRDHPTRVGDPPLGNRADHCRGDAGASRSDGSRRCVTRERASIASRGRRSAISAAGQERGAAHALTRGRRRPAGRRSGVPDQRWSRSAPSRSARRGRLGHGHQVAARAPDRRHHAFATDRDGDTLSFDADHRGHGVIGLPSVAPKGGAGIWSRFPLPGESTDVAIDVRMTPEGGDISFDVDDSMPCSRPLLNQPIVRAGRCRLAAARAATPISQRLYAGLDPEQSAIATEPSSRPLNEPTARAER